MPGQFAVKRLSAVEVRPNRSHQHEFHGGQLRRALGLTGGRVTGRLRLLIFRDDRAEPIVDESQYTLYDARERHPRRSEWHLYYTSRQFQDQVEPGDLLVIYRAGDGDDLNGVVLRHGSSREQRMLSALDVGDQAIADEFRLIEPPKLGPAGIRSMAVAMAIGEATEIRAQTGTLYPIHDHPLVARAVAEQAIPMGRDLADAAAALVALAVSPIVDPDRYLMEALDAETHLYFRVEEAVNAERLASLWNERPSMSDLLNWAMRIHQSRRSRRGQSLQRHFETVLRAWQVPFGAQCPTEPGETPDFLIPSCAAYADPDFPQDRLRMIACKTTSKERWRQILNEAQRIPDKYLLTLDTGLTVPTLRQMAAARLHVFLPERLLNQSYSTNPARAQLGTVRDLLTQISVVLV